MEGLALTHSQPAPGASEYPVTANAAGECRVLIVDHDVESATHLRTKLSQAGFTVSTLRRAEDARTAVDRDNPHLIMIDWDLPTVIAMDVMRYIRRDTLSPGPRLIALSSFSGEQHVCSGFDLGVDDYVIKPFSVPELMARVRAVLRSMRTAQDDGTHLEFCHLQMDVGSGRVTILDRAINLRNMEFRLLQFLMRRPERAFSRESLLSQVWGDTSSTGVRAVDVTVQRIRRALKPHGCGDYLQTVRSLGYRLSSGDADR